MGPAIKRPIRPVALDGGVEVSASAPKIINRALANLAVVVVRILDQEGAHRALLFFSTVHLCE